MTDVRKKYPIRTPGKEFCVNQAKFRAAGWVPSERRSALGSCLPKAIFA
ncbi:MAG: hypothetical protein LBK41_01835 [Clostridiales bacterium]|jgi:hypothetical protein|nr:hypothetical protein [Clostridiales bacterium]